MTDRTAGDRGRRLRRFLLGALIAGVLALAMSGCALLKSTTSTQLNTIGKVQITSIICASDVNSNNSGYSPADPACQGSGKGGNNNGDATAGNYQISIAYRISSGVSAPSNFTSTNTSNPPTTPCGTGVVFNQNAGLATALQGLSPAGSGKKWVAYYSTVQNYTAAGCQYLTVAPQFTLPQAFGVVSFQGPVNYRTIVGWRQVNESQPGNTSARAATCGTSITTQYSDGVDADSSGSVDMSGICADDPTAAVISGADDSQPTRDLGVIPSSNGTAHAGGSGTVSFNARYNGAVLPSGNFTLSATTNIAGATATPSPTTLNPAADSDNNVNINVTVPAGTTPGDYNVFLFATLGSEQRGGIAPATLTVGQNFTFDPAPALPNPLFATPLTLNGQAQTKTAQMNNFGVNDTTASPSGWNVTVVGDSSAGKSAVFKQYCSNGVSACGSDLANSYVSGGRTLPANSLTLNSTGATWSGGTGSAPTFPCGGGACAIDAASATKIASAANGAAGTGLWTTNFPAASVKLSTASILRVLPANEVYRLDIVWSLNSGP